MSTLSPETEKFSLDDWLVYLEHLHPKKIDLGLERIRHVAGQMDLLKPASYVITVAGTNGKGTTCRTLEMILLSQGYRVGVYSSPHLIDYTERIRIQDQLLPQSEHVAAFREIERQRGATSLSYFEFSTLSALWLFKKHQVEVAILEVGVGGRLDATNVIDSDIAVITSIALDHLALLGDTRDKIGYEKAGILRAECSGIIGEPDCPQAIRQYAAEIGTKLHLVSPNLEADWSYEVDNSANCWSFESTERRLDNLPMPNVPVANAATALACLVHSQLVITDKAIRLGLSKAQLTGRFQQISHEPQIYLDVAHNPHAASYLATKLQQLNKKGRMIAVVGILADKDIPQILAPLQNLIDEWFVGSLQSERGASAAHLASYLPNTAEIECFENIAEAFKAALQSADDLDIVIVFGSFYTVGAILETYSSNI